MSPIYYFGPMTSVKTGRAEPPRALVFQTFSARRIRVDCQHRRHVLIANRMSSMIEH
jgi:hypothetical protein